MKLMLFGEYNFKVDLNNSNGAEYNWEFSYDNGNTWKDIAEFDNPEDLLYSGEHTNKLRIRSSFSMNNYLYRLKIETPNNSCLVYSEGIKLNISGGDSNNYWQLLDKQIVEYDFSNTYDVKSFIEIAISGDGNTIVAAKDDYSINVYVRKDGVWDLSHGISTCQGLIPMIISAT